MTAEKFLNLFGRQLGIKENRCLFFSGYAVINVLLWTFVIIVIYNIKEESQTAEGEPIFNDTQKGVLWFCEVANYTISFMTLCKAYIILALLMRL